MAIKNYGYSNARIRAMKSYLFDKTFYEQLLSTESLIDVIATLEKGPYGKDIEGGTLKHPGPPGVEEGLRRNISRTFQKVLEIVDGEAQELVRILLGRWDVQNLKTILRGKHVGASIEEILDSLVPAGSLEEALLMDLAKGEDLKACLDLLALWEIPYAKPLTESFPAYAKDKKIASLELALDKFYYAHALNKVRGKWWHPSLNRTLVEEVLKREIDFINIMVLLGLSREEIEAEKKMAFFIPGGKELSFPLLRELAHFEEIEEIIQRLEGISYGKVLQGGLSHFFESGSLSVLERRMERMIIQKSVSLFKGDPLSIALIIGYLWAKFNEVVNLRIIVEGKAAGLPEKKIREGLVFA